MVLGWNIKWAERKRVGTAHLNKMQIAQRLKGSATFRAQLCWNWRKLLTSVICLGLKYHYFAFSHLLIALVMFLSGSWFTPVWWVSLFVTSIVTFTCETWQHFLKLKMWKYAQCWQLGWKRHCCTKSHYSYSLLFNPSNLAVPSPITSVSIPSKTLHTSIQSHGVGSVAQPFLK